MSDVRTRAFEIIGGKIARQNGYPEDCGDSFQHQTDMIISALDDAGIALAVRIEGEELREALRQPVLSLFGHDSGFLQRLADTVADAVLPTIGIWDSTLREERDAARAEAAEQRERADHLQDALRQFEALSRSRDQLIERSSEIDAVLAAIAEAKEAGIAVSAGHPSVPMRREAEAVSRPLGKALGMEMQAAVQGQAQTSNVLDFSTWSKVEKSRP